MNNIALLRDNPASMTAPSTWYVYIVQTSRQLLYTGIATDVDRRFQQHRDVYESRPNAKGAKYFRAHEPVAVVYQEACPNRSVASQREHAIKCMTRVRKLALIGSSQCHKQIKDASIEGT